MKPVFVENEESQETSSVPTGFTFSTVTKEKRVLRISNVKPFGYFGNSPQIPIKPYLGTCPQWSWVKLRDGSSVWDRDSEDTD